MPYAAIVYLIALKFQVYALLFFQSYRQGIYAGKTGREK